MKYPHPSYRLYAYDKGWCSICQFERKRKKIRPRLPTPTAVGSAVLIMWTAKERKSSGWISGRRQLQHLRKSSSKIFKTASNRKRSRENWRGKGARSLSVCLSLISGGQLHSFPAISNCSSELLKDLQGYRQEEEETVHSRLRTWMASATCRQPPPSPRNSVASAPEESPHWWSRAPTETE